MSPRARLLLCSYFVVVCCSVGHHEGHGQAQAEGDPSGEKSGMGHLGDMVAHLEVDEDRQLRPVEDQEEGEHGIKESSKGDTSSNEQLSKHELYAKKWGRDPQLCDEFFEEGAAGRCPKQRPTCCGLLNTSKFHEDDLKVSHVDVYCCHDTEKCCQGRCCGDQNVCCHDGNKGGMVQVYGQCCDKNRGCCTDLRGNATCCQTMLGRYWWVIAVLLTIYMASKIAMMVRRYRAMPDVGKHRLVEDRKLSARIKNMTYCC